jgi:predicted DNA-binding transcriptional regulator YafY
MLVTFTTMVDHPLKGRVKTRAAISHKPNMALAQVLMKRAEIEVVYKNKDNEISRRSFKDFIVKVTKDSNIIFNGIDSRTKQSRSFRFDRIQEIILP